MGLHNENRFENDIRAYLAAHGWMYVEGNALLAEAQLAIEPLTERRSAPICAAVSCKMDVRGFEAIEGETA